MPHFRRLPPSGGVPPEVTSRTPVPVSQPDQARAGSAANPTAGPARRQLGLPKLNPHTFEPDISKVLQAMLGKEPHVDPDTGHVVLDRPAPAPAAPFGDGRKAAPHFGVVPVLGRVSADHDNRTSARPPG